MRAAAARASSASCLHKVAEYGAAMPRFSDSAPRTRNHDHRNNRGVTATELTSCRRRSGVAATATVGGSPRATELVDTCAASKKSNPGAGISVPLCGAGSSPHLRGTHHVYRPVCGVVRFVPAAPESFYGEVVDGRIDSPLVVAFRSCLSGPETSPAGDHLGIGGGQDGRQRAPYEYRPLLRVALRRSPHVVQWRIERNRQGPPRWAEADRRGLCRYGRL